MTKNELLSEIDFAIENNACLMLKAGDHFTDYIKIINPHILDNFELEVEKYGVEIERWEREKSCVKIDSIDVEGIGSMSGERNQYYVFKAKAIAPADLESILWVLEN